MFDPETEGIATEIVDSAFKVHTALGPGLLESVYEVCMAHELGTRGIHVGRQVPVPIVYGGIKLDDGLRLDLLVEDRIIVELKAVQDILPVHEAQLLTYLKLTGKRLGFLINFNSHLIKTGIRRRAL